MKIQETPGTTPASILIHTAGEDIPEGQIDLWPGIHSALVSSQTIDRKGDPAMFSSRTDKPNVSRGLRVAGAAAVLLLLIIAAFALAPQRSLLADALRHLFRPVTSEQLPAPSTRELAAPTIVPTFAVELAPAVEASQAAPLETAAATDPTPHPCEQNPYGYGCKLVRVETQAGFDAKEFPADPQGFVFRDAVTDDSGTVSMEYVVIGGGGYLYLAQGPGDEFPAGMGGVPESAIQPVWVGEHRGEYVEGMWAIGGEYKEYTWNECCVARLRWTDGERWFEISKMSAMTQTAYMTREVMIDMAANLVDQPEPAGALRLEYLSLEEAADLVDFALVRPGVLPEGFRFGYAAYDPESGRLRLNYYPEGDAAPGSASLSIVETPLDEDATGPEDERPPAAGEEVDINGFPGVYYANSPGNHMLTWRTQALEITLAIYVSEYYYGGTFTAEQVLEIGRAIE